MEIPSVEGPEALATVLAEADRRGVAVHRVSQGSGGMLLTAGELAAMTATGASGIACVEMACWASWARPWGGQLDGVVPLPVSRVTACTFGGDGLDTLYITTSQVGTDLTRYPAAGAVFGFAPGVRGRPVQPFAG